MLTDRPEIIALAALALVCALALRQLTRMVEKVSTFEMALSVAQRDAVNARQQHEALQSLTTSLTNLAFDALLVVDAERRVVSLNEAAQQLFNVTQNATGQTLMLVTRNHEIDALVGAVLRGEKVWETQLELREHTYRVRVNLYLTGGRKVVALYMQDVSELLRLSRARRDMVSNFSHDLRTPISSIRLMVDRLSTDYGRSPERDKRDIARLVTVTDSLQHMMQNLVDLSTIESGKAISKMIPCSVAELIRSAVQLMEAQLDQKKIQVVLNLPTETIALIDPDQTRRVFTNVIHNSIKFTPNEGHITISLAVADHLATVRVRDTGIGIPPSERTRIFERFYQVDNSRSRHAGSSGLGLSIAKHIVEAQGGTIWAEAAIPSGAQICFTLPLVEQASEPRPPIEILGAPTVQPVTSNRHYPRM